MNELIKKKIYYLMGSHGHSTGNYETREEAEEVCDWFNQRGGSLYHVESYTIEEEV